MGNTHSQSARSFLNSDPDFGEYVHAEWRSQRVAELDALGGLGRPPLLLGQSFDAKMVFLGSQLQQQGQKMQEIILPPKPSSAKSAPNGTHPANPKVNRAFFLNIERRLAVRRGELVPPNPQAVEALEALGVHSGKAIHVHQLDLRRLKDQNKDQDRDQNGSPNQRPSKDEPAEWRKRVHKARRNAFLLVLTMNRLKRGHSYPKRLPFVEDLNFTIPQTLGEDCPRFIEVQQRCGTIRQTIRSLKTELGELLRSSADDISAALPNKHPPTEQQLPHQLPQQQQQPPSSSCRPAAAPPGSRPHAAPASHDDALASGTGNGAHKGGGTPSPVGGNVECGVSKSAIGSTALSPTLGATNSGAGTAECGGMQHSPVGSGAASADTAPPQTTAETTGAQISHAAGSAGTRALAKSASAPSAPVPAPAPTAGGHAAAVRALSSRPLAAPAATAAAESPVKRAQALPTVREGSSHPRRKPSPSSARYASPSRRPWGVNSGALLGSASTSARARPGGAEGSLGGVVSSTNAQGRRMSSGDGEGRGGDGVTRAYPKPWRVGAAIGGEARKEEGEGVGRAGSARSKLASLTVPLPPPRHAAQRLLQPGTEQALVPSLSGHGPTPKLIRQCSLPPLREVSSSSEGSSEDANSTAWSPAEDGALTASKTPIRSPHHPSPKHLSSDRASRRSAEASSPGLLVPPQGKMQQLQGTQHHHHQHSQQQQQEQQQQQQQQSDVQGEGNVHLEHPPTKAVDRRTRMQELGALIEEQYVLLRKARDLLSMFVNRANGGWTEAQKWEPPDVASNGDVSAWTKSDQFAIYKADVIRQLRLGQIAVQLMVGEDALLVPPLPAANPQLPPGHKRAPAPNSPSSSQPRSVMQDVWTADPWELIDQCRPTARTAIHRLEGLSLGGRAVAQMVLSLRALAGEEAVKRLHVLLHVNEDQEEEMVAELHQHKWFGLSPEHVLIVMAQRRPSGLRFNAEDLAFLPDAEPGGTAAWAAGSVGASTTSDPHQQGPRTFGTGHAMVNLGWAGHAYTIGPEGLHQPVHLSVLELLQSNKVQWMLSRRARDLGLLTKEGVFDLNQLAYALHLRDQARATAILEVCFSSSQSNARQHDSVIMQQKCSTGGATDVSSISDLRQSDIVSKTLMGILDGQCRAPGSPGLALGMGRCLYHLPTLSSTMTSLAVFRPRLNLHKECVNVSLDAADLIAHGKARARAVESRSAPGLLTAHSSLDALLPLLQAQDHDATFHDLVMDMVEHPEQEATPQARMVTHQDLAQQPPGTPIIVFIARNGVAAPAVNVAANLARPGRDKIILVTFVPTIMQQAEGEELLAFHQKGAFRSMAQVETEVVVRGPLGLLDNMERFVEQRSAAHAGQRPLVVMGSVQITSALFCYVAGSVTLSFIRRCGGIPVVVVTANSKQVPEKAGMRCLALVEGHSRAMMNHLCRNIIQESRGDRLLLTQVLATTHLTRQQQANYRHLLDNFYQIAHSHQLPVQKALVGDGPLDKLLCSVVEDHGVGMLALQLPPGTKAMPQHMLSLLRSCRSATLVYSDVPARASMLRKSGALRTSMRLLNSELAKAREANAAENSAKQGEA